jgi:hypothetical protein
MAKLVFALRGVPEDEAEEVRGLLAREGIPFHETGAGLLGISVPALWVEDKGDFQRARALIDVYQQTRSAEQREAFERARSEGRQHTVWQVLREDPLKLILYLAVVLAVLYFSIMPFLRLGQ